MKLNNKGFAISSVMYMILIMAIVLITLTLSLLSSRKLVLDKIKQETLDNIYNKTEEVIPSEPTEPEEPTDQIPEPVSFASDSWETIALNVKAGNLSKYNLGAEKEVDLGSFGKHVVRIANTTTPSECTQSNFSQTGCGFVIEFKDIITTSTMNSASTNDGGYPNTKIYKEVINNIYDSLPQDLKKYIIKTKVISSHGENGTANFETTDYLYLLATKEVYGDKGAQGAYVIDHDSTESQIRQLDYYDSIGVTTSAITGAIKYLNGEKKGWWLRSAPYSVKTSFYYVKKEGDWGTLFSNISSLGVSVAFRLETK